MNGRIFGLCVLSLLLVANVCAQSKIDEHGVQYPTDEELAAKKRIIEVLRHPTLITLRLVAVPFGTSNEERTDTPPPYKTEDFIDLRLMITHSFTETPVIRQPLDPYYDVRPELFRDGEPLPYTKKAQENIDCTEKRPDEGSGAEVLLLPGREYQLGWLRLEDWYKPLGPGHYQLTVRRRFTWDGEWLQSSPVTFEVLPEKQNPVEPAAKP
jgi:hypothetical protein